MKINYFNMFLHLSGQLCSTFLPEQNNPGLQSSQPLRSANKLCLVVPSKVFKYSGTTMMERVARVYLLSSLTLSIQKTEAALFCNFLCTLYAHWNKTNFFSYHLGSNVLSLT